MGNRAAGNTIVVTKNSINDVPVSALTGISEGDFLLYTSGSFQPVPFSHTHAISEVTGLQTALNGKADFSHFHTISDITGLQTALNAKLESETDPVFSAWDKSTGISIAHTQISDWNTATGIFIHNTGDEDVSGIKTFYNGIKIPSGSAFWSLYDNGSNSVSINEIGVVIYDRDTSGEHTVITSAGISCLFLTLKDVGTGSGSVLSGSFTENRELSIPDSSGTIALENWVSSQGYIINESDPVFTAWDKSTGISITESQISDFGSYALITHDHSGVYEPVFAKNSAFNKNFGSGLGDVCQGNDFRLNDNRTPIDSSVTLAKLASEFKNIVDMGAGTSIDWDAGIRFDKTMTGNTTFTDSDLVKGKTIEIRLTGDHSPAFPGYWAIMDGSNDYDGTVVCSIIATCIESATGSELVEYFYNYQGS